MPAGSRPVAVLCLGHVREFYPRPMLEMADWARPCGLAALVHIDYWANGAEDGGSTEDGGNAARGGNVEDAAVS
jgi:hypothetical protein